MSTKFKVALLATVIVAVIVIFLVIDWDRDGLATITELRRGTSAFNPDTDGDGLKDGLEVNTYGSNPLVSDTDNDGLSDSSEVNTYGTNPSVVDTDGDGLKDGLEINTYRTNPLVADTDGDGINDYQEVNVYKTIPYLSDSDRDGLEDGAEINEYHTNPLKSDTDKDGLPDGPEVRLLGSNPLHMDIFVEVDWMGTFDSSPISRVIKEFADAPIENPDGGTGITLHIDLAEQVPTVSEISTKHENGDLNDFYDYKDHYFSQREGFHYALICIDTKQDIGGITLGYDFMVKTQDLSVITISGVYHYPSDLIGSNFMHELGHAIGLSHYLYKGIDSNEVPFSDYPSVMNYNRPSGYYGYSSGGAFSDWNYLQENGYWAPTWGPSILIPDP